MPVDKRADIWAFGVVLCEMLTGRRLFDGDSVPDDAGQRAAERRSTSMRCRPDTPPAIRQLLRRCLERNPKNRLHDIADARIVIEDVLAGRSDERVARDSGGARHEPVAACGSSAARGRRRAAARWP